MGGVWATVGLKQYAWIGSGLLPFDRRGVIPALPSSNFLDANISHLRHSGGTEFPPTSAMAMPRSTKSFYLEYSSIFSILLA